MSSPPLLDPLRRLAAMLALEAEIRKMSQLQELMLLMVNDTQRVVVFRQAALLRGSGKNQWRLLAHSGVDSPSAATPYGDWLSQVAQNCLQTPPLLLSQPLTNDLLPPQLAKEWSHWLADHALWLPVGQTLEGEQWVMLLCREYPFDEGDRQLLHHLAQAWAYAREKLQPPPWSVNHWLSSLARHRRRWLVAVVVILVLLLPVRLSVLATTSVVPSEPMVVSSPLEGVIRTFHITPNQAVEKNHPLFSLDSTALESRLEMANKALAAEQADYLRAKRKGFSDDASKAEATFLESRVALKAAEAAYLEEQLSRVTVRALQDGIAIFNDVNDWLGKPVAVGERILYLADPAKTEMEGWVGVGDAIPIATDAEVMLFLDTQPLDPLHGVLFQQAFEARESPEKILAFSFRARFAPIPSPPIRIGLKGTAKIQGEGVTLLYYLMRRPLAALRRMVGF